jgi:RNA polymerase sigma-70 factor (ECF subfamily)
MTEDQTIHRAREGDRDAFRLLYQEHRERIFRLAYRHTRSAEDAEDVMQEAFIKAFKGLRSFTPGPGSGFTAWLTTIGLHCAIEHMRRARARRGGEHVSMSDLPQEPAAESPDPSRAAAAARAWDSVRAAQGTLSPVQRVVFDLRYRQHRDIREMADRMGSGESSVKTHLARAVGKLRKRLEPSWGKP